MPQEQEVLPLRATNADFGIAPAKYNLFSCNIPAGLENPEKTLADHRFWTYYAHKINAGDEIRCVSQDNAFYAHLYVVAKTGSDLKIKVVTFVQLYSSEELKNWDVDMFSGYKLMNGGKAGFYAKVVSTGEKVPLPSQYYKSPVELVKAMEEYLRALAA